MSEHDFTINLKINRSQADASAKAAIAAAKAIEQAHRQTANTEEKSQQKILTNAEVTEKAKQRLIEETNRAKIQAATAALKADDDGVNAINRMNAAIALTQAGLQKLGELAGAVGSGLESAANKADQLAGKFKDQRARLAELAALEGKQADSQFTVDFARFQAKTGATADEALSFRTEFMNSGAQFVGKNISEGGTSKLKEQALQYAISQGLDPRVVGDLAGNLLGFKDWEKQYGANAPQEILGSTAKVIGGVQRGRGDTGTLVKNVTSLMAQTLNEDTLKGTFQRPEDVAALGSLMAESKPDEAETMGRASIRALRAFGDSKMGPLLAEAGVTPATGFRNSAEAVGRKLQDISKAEGIPVQDVIARYAPQEHERIALSTIVNKGIGPGGALADRDAYMKQFTGESALAVIGKFRGSEEGASRSADAEIALANAQKGAKTSGVDILHRQAMAELIRDEQIDTTSSEVKKYIARAGGLGILPDWDRQMVYRRTASILSRRAAAAGIDDGAFGEAGVFGHLGKARLQWAGNKGDTETFRRGISEIQQAGGNPFGDFLPAMQANTKAVQENNDLMRGQGAGEAPRPMARPNPNPANRVP